MLMAGMQRAGGVTGWTRIAAMADSACLPLSSHILPEMNLHLVASAPTGLYLEHLNWSEPLLNERMEFANGVILVPQRPGFGLSWNEDRIKPVVVDQQSFTSRTVS
jgi:mandelate racemase